MKYTLPHQLMQRLSASILDQMGLHFPEERWSDLERGIASIVHQSDIANIESYAQQLISGPMSRQTIERLASALTVGETYFFREKRSFDALSTYILSETLSNRQGYNHDLRIWSAGCSTGEEPYSLAILLDHVFPEFSTWNITILGTDINPTSLQKAEEGIYSEWSFRDCPPWVKQHYFKPVGSNRFAVIPKIKKRVCFKYLNLAEDIYPAIGTNIHDMDIIFCRNVFLYLSPNQTKQITKRFYQSLVDGGWLSLSPVESSPEIVASFAARRFDGAVFFQKSCVDRSVGDLSETPSSVHEGILSAPQIQFDTNPRPEPLTNSNLNDALWSNAADTYNPAIEHISAKLQTSTENVKATSDKLNWAQIAADAGNLTQALKYTEEALTTDKLNSDLHYLRAVILQEKGAMEEVGMALNRALYLNPRHVLAHFALGDLARRQMRFKDANKHYSNVLALLKGYQPNDALPNSDGMIAGRLQQIVEHCISGAEEHER